MEDRTQTEQEIQTGILVKVSMTNKNFQFRIHHIVTPREKLIFWKHSSRKATYEVISGQFSLFIPLENIRKTTDLLIFSGDKKGVNHLARTQNFPTN